MRSRADLLEALIEDRESIDPLMKELREYGWDSETELVTLKPEHVSNVLNKFISGGITSEQVRSWANAIECREDIAFLTNHEQTLDEMIFWLANPEINYPITKSLAQRVIKNLESNRAN